MNKFNLLHPDDRPKPKQGILKRAWGQIKRPRSIALAGALALHAAVLPEPTKHIAKRVGLEALMVVTNQYPNSKKIIRQDFEITEERRLRRLETLKQNEKEWVPFQERLKPILDGSIASVDRLTGDFEPPKLIAEFERLTLAVQPKTIEEGTRHFDAVLKEIYEEHGVGTKITRGVLHTLLDKVTMGKTYELTRSSSFESAALGFAEYTQDCDARNSALLICLWLMDHDAVRHMYVQQFADHLRVLYEIDGNFYILEAGANKFPDEKTTKAKNAVMPFTGYLAYRLTGKSISELEGVKYYGEKKLLDDETWLAISDLRLSYYQAWDIVKLATDFSGLGLYESSRENESNTISYASGKSMARNSKDVAKTYAEDIDDEERGEGSHLGTTANGAEVKHAEDKKDTTKGKLPGLAALPDVAKKSDIPKAVDGAPAPVRQRLEPPAPLLSDAKLDEVMAIRAHEQERVEAMIEKIEIGKSAGSNTKVDEDVIEVDIIEYKNFTRADFDKFLKAPGWNFDEYKDFYDLLNDEQKIRFRNIFGVDGRFPMQNLVYPDRMVGALGFDGPEMAQKFNDMVLVKLPKFKFAEYESIETGVLQELIKEGTFQDEQPRGVEHFTDLSAVHALTLDNLAALEQDKTQYTVKLSAIKADGLAFILSHKKPFRIIVDCDLEAMLPEGQKATVASLSLEFFGKRIETSLAKKLAALGTELLLYGEVPKSAALALSASNKSVIIEAPSYMTGKLMKDSIDRTIQMSKNSFAANIPGAVILLMITAKELDDDAIQVLHDHQEFDLILQTLEVLKPSVAAKLNRKGRLSFPALKNLSVATGDALKGEGSAEFSQDLITKASSQEALKALGQEVDGKRKKLVINTDILSPRLASRFQILWGCLQGEAVRNGISCAKLKPDVDQFNKEMDTLRILMAYPGEMEVSSYMTYPYEIARLFLERTAKTTLAMLTIGAEHRLKGNTFFGKTKDQIRAEFASNPDHLTIGNFRFEDEDPSNPFIGNKP